MTYLIEKEPMVGLAMFGAVAMVMAWHRQAS